MNQSLDTIVQFRMVGNQTLIGRTTSSFRSAVVTVEHPLEIIVGRDELTGRPRISFRELFLQKGEGADTPIKLDPNHILTWCVAGEELQELYELAVNYSPEVNEQIREMLQSAIAKIKGGVRFDEAIFDTTAKPN